MAKTTKRLLETILVFFFAIQFSQTCLNTSYWPFCPYNMFSLIPAYHRHRIKAIVYQDDNSKRTVELGNVLPIEYFRTRNLIDNVYVNNHNSRQQTLLAEDIVFWLNNKPWKAFDETYASVTVTPGHSIVGIDIVKQSVDFSDYSHSRRIKVLDEVVVYSYHKSNGLPLEKL